MNFFIDMNIPANSSTGSGSSGIEDANVSTNFVLKLFFR